METIELCRIVKRSNVVRYSFSVSEGLKQYFSGKEFFIEYQEAVEEVPDAILAVPFVCNVLPIVWLADAELIVPELDQAFYNCIPNVKRGYETMYPESEWRGKLTVGHAVFCDRPPVPGKCAMFYSGGVDSVFTLISHLKEKPVLVSIWGSDIRVDNQDGWSVLHRAIDEAAERFELQATVVRSAFREFDNEGALDGAFHEQLRDGWWHGVKHGLAMLGHVAPLAYLYELEVMYIASSNTAENGRVRCASDPTIDNHVRFVSCKVFHDGYTLQRQKKICNIVRFSEEHGSLPLHVCWRTQTGTNCCHCEKCCRTIVGILVEGGNPGLLGFSDYQKELKQMQHVVLTEGTPYLFRVEWKWIKIRFLENRLFLKKSPEIKRLSWLVKTDFEHPEKIRLPLMLRVKHAKGIRGKLSQFRTYQLLRRVKAKCLKKR